VKENLGAPAGGDADAAAALKYALGDGKPRVEVRQGLFPMRAVLLAIVYGTRGEVNVPLTPDQARECAEALVECADLLDAQRGDQN
jgi:hypothetical protein